jgi:hypothetical protein
MECGLSQKRTSWEKCNLKYRTRFSRLGVGHKADDLTVSKEIGKSKEVKTGRQNFASKPMAKRAIMISILLIALYSSSIRQITFKITTKPQSVVSSLIPCEGALYWQ